MYKLIDHNVEDHNVKCRTAIKVLFLYFNLCLSVKLDSFSCSFTSMFFLTDVFTKTLFFFFFIFVVHYCVYICIFIAKKYMHVQNFNYTRNINTFQLFLHHFFFFLLSFPGLLDFNSFSLLFIFCSYFLILLKGLT
jgi:hypothetical protein